jgi:hypothetical protein
MKITIISGIPMLPNLCLLYLLRPGPRHVNQATREPHHLPFLGAERPLGFISDRQFRPKSVT